MAFQFNTTPVTALERPGQAVENLLSGDVDGAWRAMLTPDSLGPEERDALLNKWGIPRDSFKGRVLEAVTNPAVLAAIAGTFIFPIPTARNMFKVKEGVEGMMSKVPWMRSFAGARVAFKNTAVPEILDSIQVAQERIWGGSMSERLAPALAKFEQTAGRTISAQEQMQTFAWAANWHKDPLPGWKEAGVLFPNLESRMTPAMREYGTAVRGALDNTKETVFQNPEYMEALRKGAKRMRDAGYPDEGLDQIVSMLGKGDGTYQGIPNYVPLRAVRTELDIKMLRDAAIATANNVEFKRTSQYKMMNFLGREFYQRKGGMIPNLQDLMVIGDVVDPQAYMKITNGVRDKLVDGFREAGMSEKSVAALERRGLDDILSKGGDLVQEGERNLFVTALADHMPAQYSMRLNPVLAQYYHSVKNTFAWTIMGNGERMMGEVNRAKVLAAGGDARAAWRAHMLEDTVIPSALGKPTPRQVINANLWDHRMGEMVAWLDKPSVREFAGDKFVDWMKDAQMNSLGAFSLRGLTMAASSYFYFNTLGLNPSAAFKNGFQPVFSTGPLIGFKNMFAGHLEVATKYGSYFRARLGEEELSHVDALAKVFPEFSAAGLAGSPVTDEALGRAMDAAYRIQKTAPKDIGLLQKIQRASMAMFTATETNNRLGAFYGGLLHAAEGGMARDTAEAIAHARQVVVRSQLVGGLSTTPMAFQSAGMFSNPLLRQLAQFPVRTLEFTTEGVQEALTGNPGRLMRQVAGVYITKEVGDVLGLNLGDALMGGITPMFTPVNEKGAVLAPLPIVPPVVALGAGVASTLTGDWETIHRQLPLLIPGGVGLSRAIGMIPGPANIPQTTARWLGRKYADYEGANPLTGRIPVYTGQGSLTGYYSPWEITKYALGIHGGDIDQEAQMAQRLTKDSELMKETRRNYTDALFANDPRKAAGIESEYETRFGHRIAITPAQIGQMQARRKMTRVERELAAMPREARPQYQAAIAQTGVAGAMSPGFRKTIVGPTPSYTNDMGLLDTLDPYSISRYRNIPTSFPTD